MQTTLNCTRVHSGVVVTAVGILSNNAIYGVPIEIVKSTVVTSVRI